jgi:hypothetical protein
LTANPALVERSRIAKTTPPMPPSITAQPSGTS